MVSRIINKMGLITKNSTNDQNNSGDFNNISRTNIPTFFNPIKSHML